VGEEMTEELGKIEKPSVEGFKKGRKLYFIPLILSVGEEDIELDLKVGKYWGQVMEHLSNLESKLGKTSRIFHELVPVGGEEGVKAIETICRDSYKIVKSNMDKGAILQPLEEAELLFAFMDWGRCLSIGLQSQTVFKRVYEEYTSSQKQRNESLAKTINETLAEDEVGVLIMREGHQIQFPADIQVFYIAPPGLDELKRWLREREEEALRATDKITNEQDATTKGKL